MRLFDMGTVWLALALPAVALAQDAKQCWFRDGQSQPPFQTPCDPTAKVSACCRSDAYCLQSGACYYRGIVSRGACTDRTWTDAACPCFCPNPPNDNAVLNACTIVATDNFTCGAETKCTADNSFLLTGNNQFTYLPDQLQAILDSTRSNLTETPSSSPSPEIQAASTGGYTAGQLAGVGAGVGVPLLLAVAAFAYLLFREKKRVKELKNEIVHGRHELDTAHPKPGIEQWSGTGTSPEQDERWVTLNQGQVVEADVSQVPLELDSQSRSVLKHPGASLGL